ncbi:heterokaryon incompatibility protein-domain-containing protein [Exophiala viscosa]|uniref:heterokaryon incompatibility protein-domain-containing protein n=1 Tax=Exophiala viscosa TaxID=2486360 RepID=UPI002191D11B|nr:heterokaryon incompatibility protein-domain-containing protein [Exophiala viscosa]
MTPTNGIEYGAVRPSSTRVFDLLPGYRSAPIRCRFRHIDLDDPPPYEAIAYVCGDPSAMVPIRCDDFKLVNALRQFRFTDTRRTLWADCICINQRDVEERSWQVLLAGDIYSKASQVLIWLGDEDMETEIAVSDMNLIQRQIWPRRRQLEEYEEKSIFFRTDDQAVTTLFFTHDCLVHVLWFPWQCIAFEDAWVPEFIVRRIYSLSKSFNIPHATDTRMVNSTLYVSSRSTHFPRSIGTFSTPSNVTCPQHYLSSRLYVQRPPKLMVDDQAIFCESTL